MGDGEDQDNVTSIFNPRIILLGTFSFLGAVSQPIVTDALRNLLRTGGEGVLEFFSGLSIGIALATIVIILILMSGGTYKKLPREYPTRKRGTVESLIGVSGRRFLVEVGIVFMAGVAITFFIDSVYENLAPLSAALIVSSASIIVLTLYQKLSRRQNEQ